jgi:hypothetical protein
MAEYARLCIRSAYPAIDVMEILPRTPYRCAVGLMIKTDEVSEQDCLGVPPEIMVLMLRAAG